MQTIYEYEIKNPTLDTLGYVVGVANINDKHDRSAPSHFHWKILKCRMIIFSNFSILACPDEYETKQVHIIFNTVGDDYDKLNSLFLKYSLTQSGPIKKVTPELYQMCFQYTLTAKIAPIWNIIGYNYLINNRDFLTTNGPQDVVQFEISTKENITVLNLKPMKIHLLRSDEDFLPGEWIRVLPSLNKATVDGCHDTMPQSGTFKSYKDLRRHWKNIHGYRLPEQEGPYCTVQFWRGEPLTYPRICITRNFPVMTPMPKPAETIVLAKFLTCLKNKMSYVLGMTLTIRPNFNDTNSLHHVSCDSLAETQTVSLCTPTQCRR